MVKAIETEYAGCKFRSRLEARWAVFFDEAGIKWVYEPEGFVLKDGTKYLPDFYLPNIKHFDCHREMTDDYPEKYERSCFVEVKGEMDDIDLNKILMFSEFAPIIIVGNIPKDSGDAYDHYLDNRWDVKSDWLWDVGEFDGELLTRGIPAFKSNDMLFSKHNGDFWLCGMRSPWWDGGKLMSKALKKARQARFEYGETPKR